MDKLFLERTVHMVQNSTRQETPNLLDQKTGAGVTPGSLYLSKGVLSDPKTSDDKIHVKNLWTEIYDEKGDLIEDIGTWVIIRISYLLRHGAKKMGQINLATRICFHCGYNRMVDRGHECNVGN